MINKNREKGFYWVKDCNGWQIAEYQGTEFGYWYICGNECGMNDFEFEEINETPIQPPSVQENRISKL